MTVRWRGWTLGMVGTLALVLAGCGSTSTPSSTGIAPGLTDKAVTLVGGVQTQPNNWFPIVSTSNCSVLNLDMAGLMYMPLVYITKTDGISYANGIASGISVSNNNQTYTITLNPKWYWSNGRPVTAQDVVYGWNIINWSTASSAPWTTCGIGIGGVGTGLIKSVTAQGTHTVVVTTTKPVSPTWFEHNGLGQFVAIPKSVWDMSSSPNQELKDIEQLWNQPTNAKYQVTDGPYKFGSMVNNEYWTLVANPKYDGATKPVIKKLVFEYETSDSNIWAGLRKGTFTSAGIPNAYLPEKGQLAGKYNVAASGYGFCFNYMVPNQSADAPGGIGKVFDQQYVREALQLGIDQTAIIKDFEHNLAVPTYGPVPSLPQNKYYDPNITKYAFNVALGRKILEEHGWHLVNGVMTKNGQQLKFQWLVVSGSTTITNIAQLIQADWAKEGIVATIKQEPFNQIIAATSAQFQMEWWGGGWCYEPDYYPSGDGLFNEPSFDGGYTSKTMDSLIQETVNAKTPAQAQAALNAYQAFAAKDLPVLYLPTATGLHATKPGLYGVTSAFNPITVFEWYNHWRIGAKAPPTP